MQGRVSVQVVFSEGWSLITMVSHHGGLLPGVLSTVLKDLKSENQLLALLSVGVKCFFVYV